MVLTCFPNWDANVGKFLISATGNLVTRMTFVVYSNTIVPFELSQTKDFKRALWANKALGLFTPSTKTGCWSHDCNQPITEFLSFSLKFKMVAFLLDLHAFQVNFQHLINKYTHKLNKIVLE